MSDSPNAPESDHHRLVFGAGFSFGVAGTLLVLAVVVMTAGVAAGPSVGDVTPVLAGAFFTALVGAGLYFVAFPENRAMLPVGTEADAEDDSA